MQQDFYNEVAERYNDYEGYLKQIGEYDLEVEAMNLEAETLNTRVVKMGKGSDSTFGEDSILETIRANVLKKPFNTTELSNLLNDALRDKDAKQLQQELITECQGVVAQRLADEQKETGEKYEDLIRNIPNEKKILRLVNAQQKQYAIKEREKELEAAREGQLKLQAGKAANRRQYLERLFRFYHVGRSVNYPMESFGAGSESVPAVFIGYTIDRKKKNPFAPSQIKLRFAIANSSKYLSVPASQSETTNAIMGVSSDIVQPDKERLLGQWEEYTKQNNVDRKIRHTITGNLLQAFSDFKGKLVSYTTLDGKTVKGILLPEYWDPGEDLNDKVTVPIIKALPLIKSLVSSHAIHTSNGISIFRNGSHFRIVVPASRAKGGDIYLDRQILEVVEKNNFDKVSDKMVAVVSEGNIGKVVELLQSNHSCAVTLNSAQFRQVEKTTQRYSSRKPIELPPPPSKEPQKNNLISLLELEAEALELELLLLAA
jgi:hypothetical protein